MTAIEIRTGDAHLHGHRLSEQVTALFGKLWKAFVDARMREAQMYVSFYSSK